MEVHATLMVVPQGAGAHGGASAAMAPALKAGIGKTAALGAGKAAAVGSGMGKGAAMGNGLAHGAAAKGVAWGKLAIPLLQVGAVVVVAYIGYRVGKRAWAACQTWFAPAR